MLLLPAAGAREQLPRWLRSAEGRLSVASSPTCVWQIDLGQTIDLIADANGLYLLGALAIFLVTTVGMAWRWQLLLRRRGSASRSAG